MSNILSTMSVSDLDDYKLHKCKKTFILCNALIMDSIVA